MPRIARIVAPNYPHHITQRGNYRQSIFSDDNDRIKYLSLINEYSHKYKVIILSYCLMDNHVHFVAIPKEKDSLARAFNTAHMRYSQYFNKKLKVYGHLWQGRFYSCVLDESHLIAASKYIERNPVRSNLTTKPWLWKWSSAQSHVESKTKPIIDATKLFEYIDFTHDKWKEYIEHSDKPEELSFIRKHTIAGRPLGSTAFIAKLEKFFNINLNIIPRGRPKKAKRG